jgi:hypothetical protein
MARPGGALFNSAQGSRRETLRGLKSSFGYNDYGFRVARSW